jgi:hypothetical protein
MLAPSLKMQAVGTIPKIKIKNTLKLGRDNYGMVGIDT